jgi:LacI family transcriptional regulator
MMDPEKEVTIYDIARALNISPSTVSRGLKDHPTVNVATRAKIAETAKAMGFRINSIAKNLRQRSTRTIGVIVHELNSQFTTFVLAGIESVMTPAGYALIIAHSSESYAKEITNTQNLYDKRVDGVIAALAYDTESLTHFEPFIAKKIPVVFFDRVEESGQGIKIVIDNFRAGYDATAHLIQQGCARIAHFGASLKRNVFSDRLKGYRQALAGYGLDYMPERVFINSQTEEAIRSATRTMIGMDPRPDGVFLANDFCAAVCIRTIKEAGLRVPEDIAVVGFNNDVISKLMEPAITTINYPGLEMGEVAARQMLYLLENPEERPVSKKILIGSELIIRASSRRMG